MSEHKLYIVGIDFEREAWNGHAIRGLRAAADLLEPDLPLGYRDARQTIEGFAEDPSEAVLVGEGDKEDVSEAILKGHELSEGVLKFEVDLESLVLEVPEARAELEDDEDLLANVFSPAAYKTAIAFLALANGNPTTAYHRTWMMARATEDAALWEEVRAVFEAVFPPVDGDSGPGVVVVN